MAVSNMNLIWVKALAWGGGDGGSRDDGGSENIISPKFFGEKVRGYN